MEETSTVRSEEKGIHQLGPRAAPWLVFLQEECRQDQIFYNPTDANAIYHSIPEMSGKHFWQSPSHQGWLIMMNVCNDAEANDDQDSDPESWDCFLWNPVSLEKIKLPSLVSIDWDQLYIEDCVLSSPPTNPKGSMVFIQLKRVDCGIRSPDHLLFCRPGEKQWGTLELSVEKKSPAKLVCFKGRVHYMYINNEQLMIKELVLDGQSLSIKAFNAAFEAPRAPPLIGGGLDCRQYYVESFDELFIVEKYFYSGELFTLQVLRMDFSSNTLEEVESLGDHVLFLGQCTTASCSAKDLGYASGCVYFTKVDDKSLYAFDPEDGSISVTCPCPNLATELSSNWVMMAITARVDDGRTEHLHKKRRTENAIIEAEINKTSINDNEQEQKTNERELQVAGIWGIPNAECKACRGELVVAGPWGSLKAICKACPTAISAVKWKTTSIEFSPTTYFSPWFVFLRKDDAIYSFIDPVHNLKYIVNLSDLLRGAKIYYSKGGWLLMSNYIETFFFNPFTRAMIKLPDIPDQWKFMFYGMSFSSLPTSSDCKVFGIAECFECCEDNVHMFFIARGGHFWKEYTLKGTKYPMKKEFKAFKPFPNNPVFCGAEAFYFFDCNGVLGVLDLEDNIKWEITDMPEKFSSYVDRCFLVECEGKILSVFLGRVGNWVRICSLDFTSRAWTEVKSLGKHMLFLSRSTCISIVAPDSHMENKIFFPRFHAEHMVFYSLDTGRYHSLGGRHSAPDLYNTKEQIHCSWIEPNWPTATDKELDWLHC